MVKYLHADSKNSYQTWSKHRYIMAKYLHADSKNSYQTWSKHRYIMAKYLHADSSLVEGLVYNDRISFLRVAKTLIRLGRSIGIKWSNIFMRVTQTLIRLGLKWPNIFKQVSQTPIRLGQMAEYLHAGSMTCSGRRIGIKWPNMRTAKTRIRLLW